LSPSCFLALPLTADEYDEEVFAMTKLPDVQLDRVSDSQPTRVAPLPQEEAPPSPLPPQKAMERMLSLIDAFIVRNDLEKAHALLKDTRLEFGDHPEIQRRMKTLQVRYNDSDEPIPLKPLPSRNQAAKEQRLETLHSMLRSIEAYRELH
ncbi:MAG: hypothetical protein AAGB31_06370, partial [Bdellovibrio sp.]